MTLELDITEAKQRLPELLARAEGGEDVVIGRDHRPVVRLVPVAQDAAVADAIAGLRALRARLRGRPSTTVDEILSWRHEGHRL